MTMLIDRADQLGLTTEEYSKMINKDQAWDMVIRVRVTTMSGWEPDTGDVDGWLEDGGALELVAIESVQEGSKS